jgi:hypothetical protein
LAVGVWVAAGLLAGCRTPGPGRGGPADGDWPAQVAASLAAAPAPSLRVSSGGVRIWQAVAPDPRLPLPLASQPEGRAFLALLVEVAVDDIPPDLPGLAILLAEVSPEARPRADGAQAAAVVRAFEGGIALTPLVTDQGVGWLASFSVDASESVAAVAADLLTELARTPGFSAADVAGRSETLRVTPRWACSTEGAAAFAAGLAGPIGASLSEETLARAHREDLVRLHRRLFTAQRIVVAGTRPWPLRALAVLDGLGALSLGAGGVPEAPRAPSGDF